MIRVSALSLGGCQFNFGPGQIIPKTFKIVCAVSSLNARRVEDRCGDVHGEDVDGGDVHGGDVDGGDVHGGDVDDAHNQNLWI